MSHMEVIDENISEVMERAFGTTRIFPGRIFVCCVTRRELMVMTDNVKRPREEGLPYNNFFVLTVCGQCNKGLKGSGAEGACIKLSSTMIESWVAYRAVSKYCDGTIGAVGQIVDLGSIMRKWKDYFIQLQSADSFGTGDGELHMLPYLDAAFL